MEKTLEKKVESAIEIIDKRIKYLNEHYATSKEERLNELLNIREALKGECPSDYYPSD